MTSDRSDDRHEKHLLENFGITREQYLKILAFQGGVCYICKKRPGKKRLSVDHDHALARLHDHPEKNGCPLCIRGLLHSKCNSFLGWIRDDPAAFRRGESYLIDPPAQHILRGILL